MKKVIMRLFVTVSACLLLFSNAVSDEVDLKWRGDSEVRELLESDGALTDAVGFINEYFRLKRPLQLELGADDGPLYDPNKDLIQIPYDFYLQVASLFEEVVPDDEELQREYSIDSILHALFHEFGHAVVDQFDIPVLGKEEDAVDALASVLLIEYYENGAEMAINAAELFALEGEDRGSPQEADFWGEHSLDEQRFYSTLCHVYGSDPEAYQDLVTDAGFSEQRAESCEYEYQKLVEDWDMLLQPARR